MRSKLGIAAILATCFMQGAPAAAEDAVSFGNKTIRLYQNYAAGGSTDLFARAIAPFIAKHLPGEPQIVVEPKPGASGVQAALYIHNSAQPDGLEICLCNTVPVSWGTVQDFPLDLRDFAVAGSQPTNTVVILNNALGVSDAESLASLSEPVLFSASSPTTPSANRFKVFARLFGAEVKVIGGYRGAGAYLQSVLNGETGATSLASDYFALQQDTIAEAGSATLFAQVGLPGEGGFVREDAIDAPTLDELVRASRPEALDGPLYALFSAFNEAAAVQLIYLLPPETPAPVVAAWEQAIAAAVEDPGYVEAVAAMNATRMPFNDAGDTRERLEKIHAGFKTPEVLETLKAVAPAYFQ